MGKVSSSENKRKPIADATKFRLWGMAAGRCEICNKLLYLDSQYGDNVNLAENAHIHAVAKTGPRHSDDVSQDEINSVENLMLLCAEHHHLIDTKPENYPTEDLLQMKKAHEERIRKLTEIQDNNSCSILTFFCNIDNAEVFSTTAVLRRAIANEGMYPKNDEPIELHNGMPTIYRPTKESMQTKADELENQVRMYFGKIVKKKDAIAVFALAPQPLLFKLGFLLCDQLNVKVFQSHREGDKWAWSGDDSRVEFVIRKTKADSDTSIAFVIDLSAEVTDNRIMSVLGEDCSIYHLTIAEPNRNFVKNTEVQNAFIRAFRAVMEQIRNENPSAKVINLFPAMPASLAVRAGMDIMPKVDLPFIIYDQLASGEEFSETITIGG